MPNKAKLMGAAQVVEFSNSALSYHDFRAKWWASQDMEGVSFRALTRFDKALQDEILLEPKRNEFYNDIWHCADRKLAAVLVESLAVIGAEEITDLSWRQNSVWVKWSHQGKSFQLPDWPPDERSKVTG